jgi:MFS family permease
MRYAASRRDLLGTYAVDLIAMIFAFPYALFPFLALELGAPWALGLLYAASAAGGLAVTFTSGWVPRINRHGRAVVFGALLWGAGMALVGLTSSLWWVLLFLALAGAGDMVSGIFRGLIWNQTIPDEMRGRMAGIEMLSYSIGPQLGQVRSSAAASLTNLRMSFVTGGVMCIAGVAIAAFTMPSLWQYDVRKSVHSQRESRINKV